MLSHYNVRRSALVFTASAFVALKLVAEALATALTALSRGLRLAYATELQPIALELYSFYTSPEAKATYRTLGNLAFEAIARAAIYTFYAGDRFRTWCDRLVESHLAPSATPDQLDQPEQPAAKSATVAAMDPWDEPLEPTPIAATLPAAAIATPLLALPPAKTEPIGADVVAQPKRGRGRPKGSKNSKSKGAGYRLTRVWER
jgi:hypothetical protein